MAAEAGKRIKEAVQFVVGVFQSGQALDLITSSLQLGFAAGINALVGGFRYAISFFWHLLTDGSMWKSLGMTLLGVAAGFGAALLDAFNTPIVYLMVPVFGVESAEAVAQTLSIDFFSLFSRITRPA